MALPQDLPVVDHHCHLSFRGEGVRAAVRFRRAGGTHLFLCTQSYNAAPPRTVGQYADQFARTEELAKAVREGAGCAVKVVLAPFPVDLVDQVAALGPEGAWELHRTALQQAGARVREGAAVALGEVGWPHFDVPPVVRETAERVFDEAMAVAYDVGCPLVIHSADLDPPAFRTIAERADRAGLARHRLVKHYARHPWSLEDRAGVAASYVARRETTRAVLSQRSPWFLETDFLDDPERPGAVLDLATVPRRAHAIVELDADNVELLYRPFVESVERVYGFTPSPDDARPG